MRKHIITLALCAAAVGLSGCASNNYQKKGVSRETAQIDQLECTKSALIAKRRVLHKGGSHQEAIAAGQLEFHACARRHGYRKPGY
jgi:outer membrane lipoprotein SlyB